MSNMWLNVGTCAKFIEYLYLVFFVLAMNFIAHGITLNIISHMYITPKIHTLDNNTSTIINTSYYLNFFKAKLNPLPESKIMNR